MSAGSVDMVWVYKKYLTVRSSANYWTKRGEDEDGKDINNYLPVERQGSAVTEASWERASLRSSPKLTQNNRRMLFIKRDPIRLVRPCSTTVERSNRLLTVQYWMYMHTCSIGVIDCVRIRQSRAFPTYYTENESLYLPMLWFLRQLFRTLAQQTRSPQKQNPVDILPQLLWWSFSSRVDIE
jgi:hypothetical protein